MHFDTLGRYVLIPKGGGMEIVKKSPGILNLIRATRYKIHSREIY